MNLLPKKEDPEIKLSRRIDTKDKAKTFFIDFKKNHRGKYVSITERVNGNRRHNTVVIPESEFEFFLKIMAEGSKSLS